jgi:hypothetical protein
MRNHSTAAAGTAATETSLLLVVRRVAGHSAAGRRRLHEILVRTGSILIEETVEGLLVYPCLGKLNLIQKSLIFFAETKQKK